MNAPPTGMTGKDEVMQAVAMLQRGHRDAARIELLRLWQQWSCQQGSPLQRCTIAHFLADTEADAADELTWDLLALQAATGVADEEDRNPVDPSLASFLPSLHLNVGDGYRRLGDPARAERHVANGLARVAVLAHDGYGDMVRAGLVRLRARLNERG